MFFFLNLRNCCFDSFSILNKQKYVSVLAHKAINTCVKAISVTLWLFYKISGRVNRVVILFRIVMHSLRLEENKILRRQCKKRCALQCRQIKWNVRFLSKFKIFKFVMCNSCIII